ITPLTAPLAPDTRPSNMELPIFHIDLPTPAMNPTKSFHHPRMTLMADQKPLLIASQFWTIRYVAIPIGPVRIASTNGQLSLSQFHAAWNAPRIADPIILKKSTIGPQF